MGLVEVRASWLGHPITIVSYSVLTNGSPTSFFCSSRELRQGDPFSSYLFVLLMEALSCLINKALMGAFLSDWR